MKALFPSGNAVRHCNIEKGWLPPELFNCTTNTFVDLKIMVSCLFLVLPLFYKGSSVRLQFDIPALHLLTESLNPLISHQDPCAFLALRYIFH